MTRFRWLGWFSGFAVVLGASGAYAQSEAAPAPPPPADAPAPPSADDAAAAPVDPSAEAAPAAPPSEAQPSEPTPPQPGPEAAPPSDNRLKLTPSMPEAADRVATPDEEAAPQPKSRIFAEDWWSHARPIFELHGNFRVRAELFNKFALNRHDAQASAIWPQPADNVYTPITSGEPVGPAKCTPDEAGTGGETSPNTLVPCKNNTQAGANLRFRLAPELLISDNLRVRSQIDLLDNLVLGSTPDSYSVTPTGYGYAVRSPDGNVAGNASQATTATPPTSGVNSLSDSIAVKRAWAEYSTPVGEVRFGRMPNQWGLGMLYNSGDGYDDDYQSTVDRILFSTEVAPLDLMFAGAWDFPSEGATSANLSNVGGQPYDVAQADDVDELVFMVARKKSTELEQLALTHGELVVNTGLRLSRRTQRLTDDLSGAGNGSIAGPGTCQMGGAALDCAPSTQLTFERRGLSLWIPDVWVQLLYKKFRYELEFAAFHGSVENATNGASDYASAPGGKGYKIRQYGFATELEQKLVEDRLKLGFNFGWASGDPDEEGLAPPRSGSVSQNGDDTFSTFRFNPAYRVDLILNRNVLGRVQGTYYFRPSVSYDFMRNPNGQRLGGQFAAIWTRASEFIQAPGNARDLGIELNGSVMFQSKDGSQNDKSDEMGGFYSMLQYGVLFPMGGLDHLPQENGPETNAAQILRLYLGVLF
ncbi:MAG: TIGR04551 family protein [Polyangiaceae bacterium]|nr:TIGR04551 family protein [Polyangiaceae bacterium]